jgi:ectoine hydroxylase
MLPDDILKHAPVRLSTTEREHYFEHGYVSLPSAISRHWVERLQAATAQMMERARAQQRSDDVFVLEEGHSAQAPRLHRLYSPQDHHPDYWEFICSAQMTELAADVVGPDVKFHHAKLNFKSAHGSRGFNWHQDIQAWPHTDYSPVTIGVYINGCSAEQGPLAMIPDSHAGPLYSMYDERGQFAVSLRESDRAALGEHRVEAPTGPAGTVVLLNCRTIHGSLTNNSEHDRPVLLSVYSSADSFSYTASPVISGRLGEIVHGQAARHACFDTRPCELPPDWARSNYGGPWRRQQATEPAGD